LSDAHADSYALNATEHRTGEHAHGQPSGRAALNAERATNVNNANAAEFDWSVSEHRD
jgi:hypothetical protein